MVSFSKGSRQCVGIKYEPLPLPPPLFPAIPSPVQMLIDSLAIAELYITLATITRRFEMENYETTVDDVKIVRDFFVGVPKLDSLGVRAVVTGVLS